MWVKVCANTSLEDALMAVEAGADAVGFVFAPSKRRVDAAQVAAIAAGLARRVAEGLDRRVEMVGVFAGADAAEMVAAVTEAGLDTVQLHGGVKLELARELAERMPGVGVIQTLSWAVDGDQAQVDEGARQLAEAASAPEGYRLLMDSKVEGATGGTGVTFDWARARQVLKAHKSLRLVVAGGLNPDNVGEAIRELSPWGVDVASGVELRPGTKDRLKVEAFVREARAAKR